MGSGLLRTGIACCVIALLLGRDAQAQTYSVVQLAQRYCAIDINNQFQILAMGARERPTDPTDVVIWDRTGRHDTGIDARDVRGPLGFNDAGAIAGIANKQLFVWAEGHRRILPIPTDSTRFPFGPIAVLRLTNNGIVLFSTGTLFADSWAFDLPSSRLFDLRALTGAFIADINEYGLIGGYTLGRAYLRFPDGRTVVPWPEVTQVARVGPSGHFAGGKERVNSPAVLLYGSPDGSVSRIPLGGEGAVRVADINRRGDVLGVVSPLEGPFRPFLYVGGQLIQPPGFPIAMNDAGYMVGASGCSHVELLIPRVTAPTGVTSRIVGRMVTLDWHETYGAVDYILEAGTSAGATDIFVGSIGERTTLTATVPPGRYYVRLRARNDAGAGPASSEVIVDVR